MDPEDLQNSSFCNKSENQSETSIDPIDEYSLICYNSIDQYLEYANVDRSIDNSRRNSIDTNNEPTKQLNSIAKVATWIDSIYDLFQEPKSNPVVSQDKLLNDNISYEESEVRIIILASILALSLSLIASTMLGLLAANSSPTRQIIWNYEPPVSKPKSRRPHVALLFFDGRMNIYELNSSNNHLEFRWNITIRTPKNEGQYFSFRDQDAIHVLYGDMTKVITIIQSETDYKNKKMKNILRNKVFHKSGYFRVGNYLWIFGGYVDYINIFYMNRICDARKTMIWQIQKQRWVPGPDIPIQLENDFDYFIHQRSTGVSLGKNVGAIFFFNQASQLWGTKY